MPALGLPTIALAAALFAPGSRIEPLPAERRGALPARISRWEERAGWKLQFDGVDASGWLVGDASARVVDGWIVVPGAGGVVTCARPLALAELELESRSTVDPANAAFVRAIAGDAMLEVWDGGQHYAAVEVPPGGSVERGAIVASRPAENAGVWQIGLRASQGRDAFRAIRSRSLALLPGTRVELFDGKTLAGWRKIGDARWSVEDGAIVGAVGGGAQSFLVTEHEYGDFILDVDLKNDLPGNSGIQIRSRQDERGKVIGNQIEIDPSERAWSGGLYDEGRRGWLADLAGDPLARAAFRLGEWNHYRIECAGPHVKTWVNGVRCVDALDPIDAQGFLGLQVHAGKDTKVRWKNLVLRDIGSSPWRALAMERAEASRPGEPFANGSTGAWRSSSELGDVVLRVERRGGNEIPYRLRLHVSEARATPQDPPEQLAPGLSVSPEGWLVSLPSLPAPPPGTTSPTLAKPDYVVLAGTHMRALLDGHVVDRRIDLRPPDSGHVELHGLPGASGPEQDLHIEIRTP